MSDSQSKTNQNHATSPVTTWQRADAYENFMGRWSRLVATKFTHWLSPPSGRKWLDIGCGSGALSEAIIKNCNSAELTAVDQSEGFLQETQRRLGGAVRCLVGDALSLPIESASIHYAVSGLVLNHVSDPLKALAEMKRVTAAGGTAAVYVWDYSGKMEFLNTFWDTAVRLDPQAEALHQGRRYPFATEQGLRELFETTGFEKIESAPLEIDTRFQDFEDYWNPFLGGQGPAATYLMSLDESMRQTLRERLYATLAIHADSSNLMTARAWAVKALVRQ